MNETVHILLAGADRIDEQAILHAVEKFRIGNPVTVARDGIEAWEILKGENGRPPLPRPNMLILDINLPRMNGRELLARIRGDADLHDLMVFMLATSAGEQEKIGAPNPGVASYIVKPDFGQGLLGALALVESRSSSGAGSCSATGDRRGYVRHPQPRAVL